MRYVILVLLAHAAFAQQYEIGADIGYGFYRNGSIYSADGTAQAGIRNRFAAALFSGMSFGITSLRSFVICITMVIRFCRRLA